MKIVCVEWLWLLLLIFFPFCRERWLRSVMNISFLNLVPFRFVTLTIALYSLYGDYSQGIYLLICFHAFPHHFHLSSGPREIRDSPARQFLRRWHQLLPGWLWWGTIAAFGLLGVYATLQFFRFYISLFFFWIFSFWIVPPEFLFFHTFVFNLELKYQLKSAIQSMLMFLYFIFFSISSFLH